MLLKLATQRVGTQHGSTPSWIGGHGTEPYEQKTQQLPGSGFSFSPQPLQLQTNTQASVGMISVA
jgi:hypothetical protein